MNIIISYTISFLLFVNIISQAQETVIYGVSTDWASTTLNFYSYTDLITETEELIGKVDVAQDGKFELIIPVSKTTFIFTNLGIYRAYFYAEPGKKYELVLPSKIEKSPADILNPYFEETHIQLGIANAPADDINVQIRMFNDMYNPYYNKHVIEVLQDNDFSKLDGDIEKIERSFKDNENSFFKDFRKYRYAHLRHLALQHKAKSISEKFFVNEPVLSLNQSYMDLFHQVFDNYFQHHGRTEAGKKIYEDINTNKDLNELKNTLTKNKIFENDSLLELVILKCLYDEFYSNQFSRSGIIAILEAFANASKIDEYRIVSKNILHEITKLAVGFYPPEIKLHDADSNLVTLDQYRGKYVYLNFCSCASYTCIKEFDMLNGIYDRHKNKMELITISIDPFESTLENFLKKNNYSWKFLYYGNDSEILKNYDIRAFPTYFLIGPDGKLIQSPAPSPGENFEVKLFDIMKSRGDL